MGADVVLGAAYTTTVLILLAALRRGRIQARAPAVGLWIVVGFVLGFVSLMVLGAVASARWTPDTGR